MLNNASQTGMCSIVLTKKLVTGLINMTDFKIVTKLADTLSTSDFEGTLQDVLLRIEELYSKHGPDARLDYNRYFFYEYDHEPTPRYELYIKREETEAEAKQRLMQDAEQTRQREEREKAEFERLQKKFGQTVDK